MGTGDVVLIVLALAGQINSAMTLDLSLPTSGGRQTDRQTGRPFYGAMVERRDGSRDDDDDKITIDDESRRPYRPLTSCLLVLSDISRVFASDKITRKKSKYTSRPILSY